MERAWSPETATPQPATPRSGLARFVLEVVSFLTLTLAIPLAAEVVLRGLDLRPGTALFQPALDGGPDQVVRLARYPYADIDVPSDPQREFRLQKATNTLRVFVIGESVAAGVPYGTQFAFASWLAQRLAVETTGVQWEVVNAALGGLQSRGALTLVREIARYQPDLLIVYHGHNETATRFSAADRLWLNPHSLRS
ncbi:MAG: SGNH/GDSL hydrolase family protein, partial [Candidatus Binatia bacterium]